MLKGCWNLVRAIGTSVCMESSGPLGRRLQWQGGVPGVSWMSYCAQCMTSIQSLEQQMTKYHLMLLLKSRWMCVFHWKKEMTKLGRRTWKELNFKTPFSPSGQRSHNLVGISQKAQSFAFKSFAVMVERQWQKLYEVCFQCDVLEWAEVSLLSLMRLES